MNLIKKIYYIYRGDMYGMRFYKIYKYRDYKTIRLFFAIYYVVRDLHSYCKISIKNLPNFKNYYIGKYFKKHDVNDLDFYTPDLPYKDNFYYICEIDGEVIVLHESFITKQQTNKLYEQEMLSVQIRRR